jgi:hypothetical protein
MGNNLTSFFKRAEKEETMITKWILSRAEADRFDQEHSRRCQKAEQETVQTAKQYFQEEKVFTAQAIRMQLAEKEKKLDSCVTQSFRKLLKLLMKNSKGACQRDAKGICHRGDHVITSWGHVCASTLKKHSEMSFILT